MAQIVKLRRSSVAGQKPTNSNLQLGELALNTTDGKVYMAVSGSLGPSVEELVSTNTVNTGSIHITDNVTASFFTGSFVGDGSEIHNLTITGATNLLAFYGSDNHLTSSYFAHITNSGNTLGLGTDAYNNAAPERLMVDNGKSFNIATFQTSHQNNFAEVNIKNFGSGSNASADLVIWNDASTEETSYLNLGLNSSNYNTDFVGYANDGYLYNAANDLYVGSISTGSHGHLHLFAGNLWKSSSISIYNDGTIGFNTDKFNNTASSIPSSGDGYAVEISGSVKFDNNAYVSGTLTSILGVKTPKIENNGHNWYFGSDGNLEAAGAITASYFQGDGSQLTNLPIQNIDTSSLATTGSNTFVGNQVINGEVTASYFSGDASGLTNVPFHITGSDIFGNTVDKTFTKLQFDDSTGLNVEEIVPGTAFVSIGSHFKDIFVEGQTLLSATGSDAFEIIPEGGIEITTSITDTNSNGYIKEIKFSALALSSSLDSRILDISSSLASGGGTSGTTISNGAYKILVISSASTTWTFNHGLGQKFPIFQVFDENDKVVIPADIEAVDSETAVIRFPIPVTGRVIASLGTGPGGTSQYVSNSATWSIAHNLGTDYPIVTIWDTNRDIIFPNKIHSIDANNIDVYFSIPKSGYINVAKGGHIVSGSVQAGSIDFTNTNLISGSAQLDDLGYAITGSNRFNGNQTITGSLTLRNAKIDSTCTTISTNTTIFNLGAFDGANIDYVVKSGLNMRGGNIMGVWNGSNVKYSETSTMDLGDTTPITFTMTSDGKLNAYVASGTWTVEAMYRALGCNNNNPTPTPTATSVTPTPTPTHTPTPTYTPTPTLTTSPTLTPTPSYSNGGNNVYTFIYDGTVGTTDFNVACAAYPIGGNAACYSYSSTIQVGTALYSTNTSGTLSNPFVNNGNIKVVVDGTTIYAIKTTTGGVITDIQQCTTPTYTVGQSALGGKIAYILQSGDPGYDANVQHGLIAYSFDIGTKQWGCSTTVSGADATALLTGNQNTLDIVTACADFGDSAAHDCYNLTANGKSDWYLPSKDELNKLYLNKTSIGGFTNGQYWSSSEFASNAGWNQDFTDGTQFNELKNRDINVRPVRSF